jgi:hypothetical protein
MLIFWAMELHTYDEPLTWATPASLYNEPIYFIPGQEMQVFFKYFLPNA